MSTLLHADEIVDRDFPRARRGLDPGAVKSWLHAVARSVASLHEEMRMIREDRDRLARAIERSSTQPLNGGLRAALSELKLKRGFFGYSAEEVARLLDNTVGELARLETNVALLEAENSELRERSGPSALRDSLRTIHDEIKSLGERISLLEQSSGAARVDAHAAS